MHNSIRDGAARAGVGVLVAIHFEVLLHATDVSISHVASVEIFELQGFLRIDFSWVHSNALMLLRRIPSKRSSRWKSQACAKAFTLPLT